MTAFARVMLLFLGLTAACSSTGGSASVGGPVGKGDQAADGTGADPQGWIIAPDRIIDGRSYAEWSTRWWQWTMSLPATAHPLQDPTGDRCGDGQAGPVWFLGGSLDGSPRTRHCPIPSDRYIFMPILDGECDTLTEPPTLDALKKCANEDQELVSAKFEIDGVGIAGLEDAVHTSFRSLSPVFGFSLPADNIEGVFFGVSPAPAEGTVAVGIDDGIHILFKLPPGEHTIHGTGIGHTFSEDETYHLTIQ